METLRKPEKMSTKNLRAAIEQQETEIRNLEVHRVRMQTHHWKLVHELSKRSGVSETSDAEVVVETLEEETKMRDESRSPSAAGDDGRAASPRQETRSDSGVRGNQKGNAGVRRNSTPGKTNSNKMKKTNKRRMRTRSPTVSRGSSPRGRETLETEGCEINEINLSKPDSSSDEMDWVPQPPPPPRRRPVAKQETKHEVRPSPYQDRRLKDERRGSVSPREPETILEARRRRAPQVPSGRVTYDMAPLDGRDNKLNESTVFVSNIKYWSTEREVLELFNSVGWTYDERKPNIVVACNFAYVQETGEFDGKAYFMYSTIELANFAVETLNSWYFKGRPLLVLISRERLNVRFNHGSPLKGSSRANERIWHCHGETKPEEDSKR